MQTKFNIGQNVTTAVPVFGHPGRYALYSGQIKRIDIQKLPDGRVLTCYGGAWPRLAQENMIAADTGELDALRLHLESLGMRPDDK